jgi:ankyrin repeat protein/Tol biopolymer transport system component
MHSRVSVTVVLALILVTGLTAGEIHVAANGGDSAAVMAILKQQPDALNAGDSLGMTPLNLAAYSGHSNLAKELLARGADWRIGDRENSQPIHNAAIAGRTNIVELLVSKGADIDAQDRNGETALRYASAYRQLETARWLIEHGANTNLANLRLETPLHTAALSSNLELARLLIEHGANLEATDDSGRTPLLLVARENGNVEMAKFLLDHGAKVNAKDGYDDTPLGLVAWRGFRSLCSLLLTNGATLPTDGSKRIEMISNSAKRGMVDLFRALVDAGADVSVKSASGLTLLHQAAKGGSAELCALLVDKGIKVDNKDYWGRTPLHYAAERGRTQACSLLVSRGANVDAQSLAGYTPLSLTLEFKEDTTAALLRRLSARIEQPNFPRLQGPYFGQQSPGGRPVPFAPDIVASSRFKHGSITFSPDGLEACWSSEYIFRNAGFSVGGILTSRVENDSWTIPKLAEYSTAGNGDDVPFFSPDGDRLYFLSPRSTTPGGPLGGEKIWYIDRTSSGWSQPHFIEGGPNAHGLHWQFSAAANGNIYFASSDPRGLGGGDIWVSKYQNGSWQEAEHLGAVINTPTMEMCPFIAPDESYLIVVKGGVGSGSNMHPEISFKKSDGTWTKPEVMKTASGQSIEGICPIVSRDGKYLFLNSPAGGNADIYWVDATFIETLRKKTLK